MAEPIIVKVALTVPRASHFQHVFPPSILIHNEDRSVFMREEKPEFVRVLVRWLRPDLETYAWAIVVGGKILLDIDRGRAPRQEW
jgi:hypothetical protein